MTLAMLAVVSALAVPTQTSGGHRVSSTGAEISILTYNVRGLPWPLANGRAKALKLIGVELAAMRRDGRQPDVVLIQEGFRGEVGDLVETSGYRYWARAKSFRAGSSGGAGHWPALRPGALSFRR